MEIPTGASSEVEQVWIPDPTPGPDGDHAEDPVDVDHIDAPPDSTVVQDSAVVDEPNLHDYVLSRDRVRRPHNPPVRYTGLVNLLALAFNVFESDGDEPQTYKQAQKSKAWNLWLKAMKDEMHSLLINHTWILVPLPVGATVVDCR